jgi:Tfp pilus assembly protein PilV
MNKFAIRKTNRNSQAGLTMIEVLVAAAVVIVGFMATLGLVLTAIASNNRNRMDSTGTMLAQAVVENINSVVGGTIGSTGTDDLTDCNGTDWTIDTAVGGANLSGSQIDFTQVMASTDHHHMDYAVCNATSQTTYDVRWNVQSVTSTGTYLVTVAVKKKRTGSSADKFFALPVTLRTYVTN